MNKDDDYSPDMALLKVDDCPSLPDPNQALPSSSDPKPGPSIDMSFDGAPVVGEVDEESDGEEETSKQ